VDNRVGGVVANDISRAASNADSSAWLTVSKYVTDRRRDDALDAVHVFS
jgi:hypothetical protein